MRRALRVLGIVTFTGIILLGLSSSAWAQKEGGGPGGVFTTDPRATGTKVTGPLTVYYEILRNPFNRAQNDLCQTAETNMYFFMRLLLGKNIFGFSGLVQSSQDAKLCLEDVTAQQKLIEAYVKNHVIPHLFPASPTAPFALKAVTNVVVDDALHFPGTLVFSILDIEIAVKN